MREEFKLLFFKSLTIIVYYAVSMILLIFTLLVLNISKPLISNLLTVSIQHTNSENVSKPSLQNHTSVLENTNQALTLLNSKRKSEK